MNNVGNVVADVYLADENGDKGEFLRTVGEDDNGRWIINNRLQDILDMHIVVADDPTNPYSGYVDDASHDYVLSKGGSLLKPTGLKENLEIVAGGDIESGLPAAKVVDADEQRKAYYEMGNGHTFFIDKILQDPFKSVYVAMMERKEKFGKFLDLLLGDEDVMAYIEDDENSADLQPIFSGMVGEQSIGIGMVVSTFQNYRYTVLVPTDEAVDQAFAEDPKLLTWEEIKRLMEQGVEPEEIGQKVRYLLEFLHYHFIDGMLPVSSNVSVDGNYETAARREDGTDGFTLIHAKGGNGRLSFSCTVNNQSTNVITTDSDAYNILTRDFIVNGNNVVAATQISASSRAVIHLVDRALNFHKK